MEEDSHICQSCLNRMYNANKKILCTKNIDNSCIQFYCSEFLAESVYTEKTFLIKEDKAEYSHRKVLYTFICLFSLPLFAIIPALQNDKLEFSVIVIMLSLIILINGGLLLAIYSGRQWALIIMNIFNLLGLFGELVKLGSEFDSIPKISQNLISIAMTLFLLYFFNNDKDFRRHYYQMRNKSNYR